MIHENRKKKLEAQRNQGEDFDGGRGGRGFRGRGRGFNETCS